METHYDYFIAYTELDSQLAQTLKADVNTVEEFSDCVEKFDMSLQKPLSEIEAEVDSSERILLLIRKEAYTNVVFLKLCAYVVERIAKSQIFPYITDNSSLPFAWNSLFDGVRIITSEICYPNRLAMYALDEITPRQMEGEVKYDKGVALYEEGKISEAIKLYHEAAELDYDYAQSELGDIFYFGTDTSQNLETAVMWYNKAAGNGNLYAMYNLGYCYENGEGVVENIATALYWYNEAAERGYEDNIEALKRNKKS